MATAEIRARASLDSSSFNAGLASMKKSAMDLKGVIAGAFSFGAVSAFVKSSLDYAGKFQDMADQFGMSASKLSGLDQAFRSVGGSTENLVSVLQKLQAKAAENGTTLESYTEGVIQAFSKTGDFSALIGEVGPKNAAKFAAAIKELGGTIEGLKGPIDNATAALADFYGDKSQQLIDRFKAKAAKGAVELATFLEASAKSTLKGGIFTESGRSEFQNVYQQQRKDAEEKMRLQRQAEQASAAAAEEARLAKGGAGLSDPLSSLRSIIGAIAGSQGQIINAAGGLAGLAAMKSTERTASETDQQARRFDDLRRIGGGLIGGANNPMTLQKETRDEVRKTRLATEEVARNTRNDDGGTF